MRDPVPAPHGHGPSPRCGAALLALLVVGGAGAACACASVQPDAGAGPAASASDPIPEVTSPVADEPQVAPTPGAEAPSPEDTTAAAPAAPSAEPVAIEPDALLPARIRRLAAVEYDASVQALLGTEQRPASAPDFPPDLRQNGFTVNDAQRVDTVIIERLIAAAAALASEARANGTLARLAPCPAEEGPAACAERFIASFGAKVYRRPLLDEEVRALFELHVIGSEGASYEDGVELVLRGLLQSAGFLYVTELGTGELTDGFVTLTPHELAASLSLLLTSGPPDEELLRKAAAGLLSDPAEREAEARRLLQTNPLAQTTVVRLVREWLGIDRIATSTKDTVVFSAFTTEKPRIVAESEDFVRAVAFQSTGTLSELLGARWTVDTGPLALYQPAGPGPITGSTALDDRVGILNQAAFLASHASAQESQPVWRGVTVARRLLCIPLESPSSLDIEVIPPAPDLEKTTRERFSLHTADEACAACHNVIDPLGFAFEHFNAIGGYRELDNARAVDSAVEVKVGADLDGPYADSNALALALAESEAVQECFARFMFRAASAKSDVRATPGEDEFVAFWRALPEAAQNSIVETLIAYVKAPSFGLRGPS